MSSRAWREAQEHCTFRHAEKLMLHAEQDQTVPVDSSS